MHSVVERMSGDEFDLIWNEGATKSSHVGGIITLHYANWCAWSNRLLPEWNKFKLYAEINHKTLKINEKCMLMANIQAQSLK